MTNEAGMNEPQWMPDPANGTAHIPIPSIDYAYITVPLETDAGWVAERITAMRLAYRAAADDAQREWLAERVEQQIGEQAGGSPPLPPEPPDLQPQRPQQAAQPPQQTRGGNGNASGQRPSGGTGLWCPEHDSVQLVESLAKYQTYDDVDGVQLPAKFFCPGKENGTGQNHQVWRSQARVTARAS